MENLAGARAAFEARDWRESYEAYLAAQQEAPLDADDLNALAEAAWWLGLMNESLDAREAAYDRYLDVGNRRRAAMRAFDIAYAYFLRGHGTVGSGWVNRAQRLVDAEPDCAEQGYLLYFAEETSLDGGADTMAKARQVQDFGRRHRDRNLIAAGMVAEGRVLIKLGRAQEGVALLDEGMLEASSDELAPNWAGNVYCHLMAACYELGDSAGRRPGPDRPQRGATGWRQRSCSRAGLASAVSPAVVTVAPSLWNPDAGLGTKDRSGYGTRAEGDGPALHTAIPDGVHASHRAAAARVTGRRARAEVGRPPGPGARALGPTTRWRAHPAETRAEMSTTADHRAPRLPPRWMPRRGGRAGTSMSVKRVTARPSHRQGLRMSVGRGFANWCSGAVEVAERGDSERAFLVSAGSFRSLGRPLQSGQGGAHAVLQVGFAVPHAGGEAGYET